METLLNTVINLSLAGTLAALPLLLLRPLFKKRLPTLVLCLWAVVLLKYLVPLMAPSPFSIYSLVPDQWQIYYIKWPNIFPLQSTSHRASLTFWLPVRDTLYQVAALIRGAGFYMDWGLGLLGAYVWLCGVAAILIGVTLRLTRLFRAIKSAADLGQERTEELLKGRRIRRPVKIRVSEQCAASVRGFSALSSCSLPLWRGTKPGCRCSFPVRLPCSGSFRRSSRFSGRRC